MVRRLGAERNITWIPHIDAADLVALYQAAGAIVQPSLYKVSACRLKPFNTL
jgi:glycosyltransferase involved in cell wall biosynthesis